MTVRRHALFAAGVPTYTNAKSSCYVYGTTSEGIDTGVFIEGEGVLFLGRTAVIEMAEVLGLSFNEEGAQLELDNAHLTHQVELLEARIAELESDLVAFGRAIASAARIEAEA